MGLGRLRRGREGRQDALPGRIPFHKPRARRRTDKRCEQASRSSLLRVAVEVREDHLSGFQDCSGVLE